MPYPSTRSWVITHQGLPVHTEVKGLFVFRQVCLSSVSQIHTHMWKLEPVPAVIRWEAQCTVLYGTQLTGCKSIAGPTLTYMSLVIWRKLEYHAGMGITCRIHTESPEPGLNQGPSSCEVLTNHILIYVFAKQQNKRSCNFFLYQVLQVSVLQCYSEHHCLFVADGTDIT